MIIASISCVSAPVALTPKGDPTPFEGTWETAAPHPQNPNQMVTSRYVFHLDTFEMSADTSGTMTGLMQGTFTYTADLLTLTIVNLGAQGRWMKNPSYSGVKGMIHPYEFTAEGLYIESQGLDGETTKWLLRKVN
jgi:hypothetical protein